MSGTVPSLPPHSFRNILSHEPLPHGDTHGYVLLQGVLAPKPLAAEDERELGSDPPTNTRDATWTREDLQACLTTALSAPHTLERLGLPPCAVMDVHVLPGDGNKVRLTYASPQVARRVARAGKAAPLSMTNIMAVVAGDTTRGRAFATKALQWIRLSSSPRLSALDASWIKGSPPKFRRLLPRRGVVLEDLQAERAATRFVVVMNLLVGHQAASIWKDGGVAAAAIRSVMDVYDRSGEGVEVFITDPPAKKKNPSCHVGFRSASDAQAAIRALQEQTVTWTWTDDDAPDTESAIQQVASGPLFLDFTAVTDRTLPRGEPARSECTSTTAHVVVPGLHLVPDFVTSQAEEEILLAVLCGPQAPWAPAQRAPSNGGIVKRRVQHYGYVFDYQTANVLRDKQASVVANCPPMPAWNVRGSAAPPSENEETSLEESLASLIQDRRGWPALAGIVERVRRRTFTMEDGQCLSFPHVNQMTLNHYEPGEGIGSHVDTPSAFGDGLMSLSLQSGIVMEFRHTTTQQRKLVYLPPRSLLLMTGPARYEWEHMIVTRRTDTHEGEVLPRGVRVSLTLRTALQLNGTSPLELLESADFPLVWGSANGTVPKKEEPSSLVTPECERRHVHDVYDAIAKQWHHTRGRRGVLWPGATQFLQRLPPASLVADVGCGDGKYFPAIWEAGSFVIGTDISRPLLVTSFPNTSDIPDQDLPESRRISQDRRHLRDRPAVAVADCMNVPLRDHSCDAAICIAVLHHISTHERRIQCLRELARIVRVGGNVHVMAWAMDQEEGSRRRFATEDVFVPFNAQPKYLDLQQQQQQHSDDKDGPKGEETETPSNESPAEDGKSTAQVYSEAFTNAQYDDRKGLVVFQRYCHMYRKGELEELVTHVPGLQLLESGFEAGNYFIILQVVADASSGG
jgi:alkylated DNA repair dioxygenase AlkB/ubiquinone/menaquinone biosynthesis C-methylase UbiE